MLLEHLGWTSERDQQLHDARQRWPDASAARVVRSEVAQATVVDDNGVRTATVPSALRHSETRAAVGDWAVVSPGDIPIMHALLPRSSHFVRRAAGRRLGRQVVAANVDRVGIVSALDADFNVRRLERYLTAVHEGGSEPVIILTKAGQGDDVEPRQQQARATAPGVPVIVADVIDGIGTEALDALVPPATTIALVGSSGVGKSTLLNYWIGPGGTPQRTAPTRAHDQRGQHTTTARELFILGGGGIVIDTPGMRELSLWANEEALLSTFSDVDGLARQCRFNDCRHDREPGCAVAAALGDGTLDAARYAAYLSLRTEIVTTAAELPEHERRHRQRSQSRHYRTVQRGRRKQRGLD